MGSSKHIWKINACSMNKTCLLPFCIQFSSSFRTLDPHRLFGFWSGSAEFKDSPPHFSRCGSHCPLSVTTTSLLRQFIENYNDETATTIIIIIMICHLRLIPWNSPNICCCCPQTQTNSYYLICWL